MSRYFGLAYPGTTEGRTFAKDTVEAKTQINKAGSKWRAGDRKWGRSLMDQAEISRQTSDYYRKFQAGDPTGAAGVYNLAVLDDNGVAITDKASINIGGRMFQTGTGGRLRVLDSEYLNSEISAFKELKDYEEKIVQALLVSDETAALMIGGTFDDVMSLLERGTGGDGFKVPKLRASELKAVNARPSYIRYLDPTSVKYATAISKLRAIVHELGIIVNEEGGNLAGAGTGIKQATYSGNDGEKAA